VVVAALLVVVWPVNGQTTTNNAETPGWPEPEFRAKNFVQKHG
jgi:hypothetical protein